MLGVIDKMETYTWILLGSVFVIGIIIGRISLAMQYAFMKPKKGKK